MTLQDNPTPTINRGIVFDLLLRAIVAGSLCLVGFAIVLGQKWENTDLYFGFGNGHGFTTQDAVALIPIIIGLIWFGLGLWKYHRILRLLIQKSSEIAFLGGLTIGLLIGGFLGTGFGAVFENTLISIAHQIFR